MSIFGLDERQAQQLIAMWEDHLARQGVGRRVRGGTDPAGLHVCKTTTAIAARTGSAISSGTVTIYKEEAGAIIEAPDVAGNPVEETAYNWIQADLAADEYHFIVRGSYGTWWIVAEDYLCGDPPMPEPPASTGLEYVGKKDSPGYWVPAEVQTTGVSNKQVGDALLWDGTNWVNAPLGLGGMYMAATSDPGPSFGAGWVIIDQFDTINLAVGCTLDPSTGQFVVTQEGYWDLRLQFNFSHNESNQGRETFVRAWDLTAGAEAGDDIPLAIARNQPGSQFSYTFRVNVRSAGGDVAPGNVLRWEIGGGDSITSVVWNLVDFDLTQLR